MTCTIHQVQRDETGASPNVSPSQCARDSEHPADLMDRRDRRVGKTTYTYRAWAAYCYCGHCRAADWVILLPLRNETRAPLNARLTVVLFRLTGTLRRGVNGRGMVDYNNIIIVCGGFCASGFCVFWRFACAAQDRPCTENLAIDLRIRIALHDFTII